MADVSFIPIRGSEEEIAETPREDGQFLYTTDSGTGNKVYADVLREGGTIERVAILGDYVDKNGDTINGNLGVTGNIEVGGDLVFTSSVGTSVSLRDIFKSIYPIGCIYMSTTETNPSTMFGGSWVEWGTGRVPVGIDVNDGDFDTVEKTGGLKSHTFTPSGTVSKPTFTGNQISKATDNHTLTVSEIPSHIHDIQWWGNTPVLAGGDAGIAVGIRETLIGSGSTRAYYSTTRHEYTQSSGGDGGHSHNFSLTPSGSVSQPTFTGNQTNQSHLQPYITCYMWKRVS